MSELNDVVQPSRTEAEIVIKIGARASIMLDLDERNGGPPCLCIQGDCVQLLLYPHGWYELGEVTKDDLDRLSDLVIDITRMRDAVLRKLRQQGVLDAEGART
ncbi:hypothetical protein AB0M47_29560 [Hamadaea sp. NPDC051192]|uniref:hypothetical protein n=1 Tax=Hamadaea sp. NPDC051192 TaxID=3154940 RepID=UPI003428D8A1